MSNMKLSETNIQDQTKYLKHKLLKIFLRKMYEKIF